MASTITAGFEKLRQNLEITDLQAATASGRQSNVRKAIEAELTVLESFLVGSYNRNTMISPLKDADIDIFVVLDPGYFKDFRPAALLDKVRRVLLKTYTKTPAISRNGQAVTITFTDFRVDVVPAFRRTGGGYLIPDSPSDKWVSTDPTKHDEALTAANKTHGGRLIPLVKMIKGWNRGIGGAFSGFYLELLVVDSLRGITTSDYPSGVRFVLDKGREKVKFKLADPAGLGDFIDPLASVTSVADAVSRFSSAHNRAVKAEALAQSGQIDKAFDEWRKIFNDYYPAYS